MKRIWIRKALLLMMTFTILYTTPAMASSSQEADSGLQQTENLEIAGTAESAETESANKTESAASTAANGSGHGTSDGQNTAAHDTPDSQQADGTETAQEIGVPASAIPLGSFRLTAYCPCRSCSGRWGRHTSSGAVASSGRTVAVDPSVIPIGSRLYINGTVYTAEDIGGGVRGRHIDIFFDTHGQTRAFGSQSAEIYLVS